MPWESVIFCYALLLSSMGNNRQSYVILLPNNIVLTKCVCYLFRLYTLGEHGSGRGNGANENGQLERTASALVAVYGTSHTGRHWNSCNEHHVAISHIMFPSATSPFAAAYVSTVFMLFAIYLHLYSGTSLIASRKKSNIMR